MPGRPWHAMLWQWLDFLKSKTKDFMRAFILAAILLVGSIFYSGMSVAQVDSARLAKAEQKVERQKKQVDKMNRKIAREEKKARKKEKKAKRQEKAVEKREKKRDKQLKKIRRQEEEIEKAKSEGKN